MIFSTGAFSDELKAIPRGVPMALFGLCLDMTDVLVRGVYQGLRWGGTSPLRCSGGGLGLQPDAASAPTNPPTASTGTGARFLTRKVN